MTRIYDNSGFAVRMNISCVVIVLAALFGAWEVWNAYRNGSSLLFAFFFIGGAIYAAKQLRDTSSDSVVALDADAASGEAAILLWRPFRSMTITGPLAQFSDWQFHEKKGRVATPFLTARHPGYPRPMQFELHANRPISEGLRTLAPEAVAAFEHPPAPTAPPS